MRLIVLFAIVASIIALATAAHAQSAVGDDVRTEAKAHYDRGKQFFSDGDFVAAAVEFGQAAQLYSDVASNPDGTIRDPDANQLRRRALSNEATSYSQADLPVEALDAFALLRDQYASELSPDELAQIDQAIGKLRDRISTVTLVGVPKGAEVRVDGRVAPPEALTTGFRIGAGEHAVEVHAETFKPYASRFTVAGHQKLEVPIKLETSNLPARVRFESSVQPSRIELDGKPIGSAPLEIVATPGKHSYKVTSESYRDNEGTFEAVPGERAVVNVGMVPRRSPNGTRYEPFISMHIPLSTSPVEDSVSFGSGVRVFLSMLRYRNIRLGFSIEQINRTLNSVTPGFVIEWCPDSLGHVGPFAICPVNLSALNGYGGGVGVFSSGGANASGRAGPAIEIRGDTLFVRVEVGLGFEKYTSTTDPSLTLGEIYSGVAVGVDL